MGTFIKLSAADGAQTPAYVAQPLSAPKGAVVVLQEIFGVNQHIQEVKAFWPLRRRSFSAFKWTSIWDMAKPTGPWAWA